MQTDKAGSKILLPLILIFVTLPFLISGCQPQEPAQVEWEPAAIQETSPAPTATQTLVPITATSAPQPTAAPGGVTLTTVDGEIVGPPLPPVGFEELLERKVERGEWTYEEGLITLLKFFVGEVNLDAVPEAGEVISNSGTGIGHLALELASDPDTDPGIAEEIERLLNIIAPTAENLNRYSEPATESQSGIGNPKMAKQVEDSEFCEILASKGYDDEDAFPGVICYKYVETDVGNGETYRVYYPADWGQGNVNLVWVDLALEAMNRSAIIFDNLGNFNGVYLLFSARTEYTEGKNLPLAHQYTTSPGWDCPVTLFHTSNDDGEDVFKQNIAHELFHCFQDWNFTTSPHESHEWWLEGSAVYFSNVVYPTVNNEYRFLDRFNYDSTQNSLMEMNYHNFVFFQYMGNQIGNPTLIQLLDEMSAIGGPQAHAEYLSGFPGMRGFFQDFVVSFASSGVPDTGGGNIVPGQLALSGYKDIKEEEEVKSESRPFVATRYGIRYEKEKRFLHSWSDENEGDHSYVFTQHRLNKTHWGTFPEEVRSTCDDSLYTLALTTIKDDYTFIIEVNEVEKADCDPCLLGSWDIDPDSYNEFVKAVMVENNAPQGIQMQVSGHYYLTFDEEGLLTTLQNNLKTEMTIPNTPNITTSVNAHGAGQYSTDGEVLEVINLIEMMDSFTGVTAGGLLMGSQAGPNAAVSIFGTTIPLPGEGTDMDIPPQSQDAPYTCDNEKLTITMDQGPVVFLRVEEIPPTPVPTTLPDAVPQPDS